MSRVLHLCDCFAGGVRTAIEAYIARSPEASHTVVAGRRSVLPLWSETPPDNYALIWAPGGIRDFAAVARRTLNHLRPDVIHAHSTVAGAIARILPTRTPIIFTPHTYAFARRDISGGTARLFKGIEAALAPRTATLAGASTHECNLAAQFAYKRVVHLPHALARPQSAPRSFAKPSTGPLVASAIGLLNKAKDPGFFIRVVRDVRQEIGTAEVAFRWIGDGDATLRDRLEAEDIEVTGYLRGDAYTVAVQSTAILVHGAAWEVGVPLAVIEAASDACALVIRDIEPVRQSGVPKLVPDSSSAAQEVVRLISSPEALAAAQRQAWQFARRFAPEAQIRALRTLYGLGL